ncbi:MAG: PHP domain-containing protein [Candidatus Omnitrophica bacterium]|nr:PHP domain-containing protein [Candidatus Omnitrophota bacterium]
MKFADLHLHTNFSDGTYSPQELVRRAAEAGIDCIAVVDHDSVDGIKPAQEAARSKNIEVIPGIELSCEHNNSEVHILGYFIDYADVKLTDNLAFIRKIREARIYEMVEKLKASKVDIKAEDIFALSATKNVGRMHVAQALINKGYVSSAGEAFYKYIGDNSPAYVCGFKLKPKEAIELIASAKGIPVLAHPYTLGNDELIVEFIEYGLRGLEVYYPEHTNSKTIFYENMARQYGLLATGGSDCHGRAKPEISIGAVKIPYVLVEKLKEEKEKYEKRQ